MAAPILRAATLSHLYEAASYSVAQSVLLPLLMSEQKRTAPLAFRAVDPANLAYVQRGHGQFRLFLYFNIENTTVEVPYPITREIAGYIPLLGYPSPLHANAVAIDLPNTHWLTNQKALLTLRALYLLYTKAQYQSTRLNRANVDVEALVTRPLIVQILNDFLSPVLRANEERPTERREALTPTYLYTQQQSAAIALHREATTRRLLEQLFEATPTSSMLYQLYCARYPQLPLSALSPMCVGSMLGDPTNPTAIQSTYFVANDDYTAEEIYVLRHLYHLTAMVPVYQMVSCGGVPTHITSRLIGEYNQQLPLPLNQRVPRPFQSVTQAELTTTLGMESVSAFITLVHSILSTYSVEPI